MDINTLVEVLINLSLQKQKSLKELLGVTTLQSNLINNEQLDSLMTAIERKQQIIHNVNVIDIEFLEKYNNLKEKLGIQTIAEANIKEYPVLNILRTHINAIMELLKEINEIDEINKEKLNKDFSKVKEELKKIKAEKHSAKITSAYKNKYKGVQGVFVDNRDK
ncbi:MAG: flagellar protein FlgN [Anaerosolibacter sp.]|jgi:hypothetical protein|uniref:flagellar export chaperone FlgN n=1 Tax=Anaerosolibacter sp. TaxID=1872527 RepID=UPI002631F654|nr:flagellar export chaperone FlgN [Anaerosolibacter sp.]MDF2546596.1 flagellar protein FlgN [Anaerosolibacter sp.]